MLILQSCNDAESPEYFVWAADQNANELYILDPDGDVVKKMTQDELGGAERPHMLWGIPPDPFIYSANTVSGDVTVLDSQSRETVSVVSGVGKLPHAAQPNPARTDYIYVSNIGPQEIDENGNPDQGETISEIVRNETNNGYTWEVTRFLDLKAEPLLADDEQFPSRRPVCAGFTPDGKYKMVTLFNGGLALVDLDEWRVSKAWGKDEIAEHGCGFAESPVEGEIYVTAGDMHSSWLYVFDLSGSEPELVTTHNLSDTGQDSHGAWVDRERNELWVVHRVSDNVTIHPLDTIRDEDHTYDEIEFVGSTPDLITMSPGSDRAFLTLRGPNPAPTIPHDIVGERTGISILDVESRELISLIELGDAEMGDFHGIFIPMEN
ncbi:hypothetical protein DYD21_19150 [Rhodohalobacter sp. SW132]|uniref:YncE family protein n=1 Tax=Rhodohalobacter sp. SW132 TaxID=2293433 RepID=UPI000E27EAAA|nr:hypothetical protein [Rhodohalobacter sp. SW132]REL24325.1 hypothetical protein DYD21_19150 [Rhodohalobacter sp. SW132]